MKWIELYYSLNDTKAINVIKIIYTYGNLQPFQMICRFVTGESAIS